MTKWDAGRFLNTVSYFEAIPVFSSVKRLLTGKSTTKSTTDGERTLGVILLVGATGEIGHWIVQQLLKTGYGCRGIVRDLKSVPFSVPANVEFLQVDLDRNDALTPQILAGVRGMIICRDAENPLSPSALQNLTTAANLYLPTPTRCQLFDFTQPNADLQATWGAVDDVVMGGVSESGIRLESSYAIFSGRVSIDNSGGFASVRTRNFAPSLDLNNYQGVELRVRGDGQRYKLFIRTEPKWDSVGYAYSFDTIINEWMTISIPFKDLVPVFRAKTVENAPPIDSSQICALQLMLSKFEYDRELNPRFTPGLFSLEVESISAYGGQITPQLVLVNSIPNESLSGNAIDPDLLSILQNANLPYSIVRSHNLDPQMVSMIAVKSLTQPETVGQILGH
jgi:hypothetical protein